MSVTEEKEREETMKVPEKKEMMNTSKEKDVVNVTVMEQIMYLNSVNLV